MKVGVGVRQNKYGTFPYLLRGTDRTATDRRERVGRVGLTGETGARVTEPYGVARTSGSRKDGRSGGDECFRLDRPRLVRPGTPSRTRGAVRERNSFPCPSQVTPSLFLKGNNLQRRVRVRLRYHRPTFLSRNEVRGPGCPDTLNRVVVGLI